MDSTRRQGPRWLAWLSLFGVAIALRSLSFPFVFVGDRVRVPGGYDEFYHLRRIWFTVVNFPAGLAFDRYLDHPRGARPPWTPLFDWGIGALARLLAGAGSQSAVEAVAVWVPPVLGALTVVAVALLARRCFGPAAGWLSGLLLAVLPVHIGYSELSAVDHHVAVVLLALLLVGAAMRLAEPLDAGRWRRGIVATGALAALLILLWPGGLLHVLVVQLFLVGQLLLVPARAEARTRAHALAALHGLTALLLAPFCLGQQWTQYGALSPLVLTDFQPLWFACGAAALGGVATLWRRDALGASRPRRIASGLALAAAGLTLACLAIPGLVAAVANAADWFSDDAFLGRVLEMQPLLFTSGRFTPREATELCSYLFWAYPLAAGGLVWQAARRARAEVLLMVAWSATFLLLALLQRRWCDAAGPGFALVVGCALAEGWRTATRRLAPARRPAALLLCVLVLGLALQPSLGKRWAVARAAIAALQGIPVAGSIDLRRVEVLERTGRWLREASPPTRGYLRAGEEPEYGVLSAWGHGHILRYYAERPMVEDNFGPYAGRTGFDAARAYYASTSEAAALDIALANHVRYVVASPQGSGQMRPAPGTMAARLALARSSAGAPVLPADALAHHRLCFVADDAAPARALGEAPWTVAVYEIVKGARVTGQAAAGETLRFELPLYLPGGGVLLYSARTSADASGRYELRLPYPTGTPAATDTPAASGTPGGASPAGVRSGASYRVRAGSRSQVLSLGEDDVREGRTVLGPGFLP